MPVMMLTMLVMVLAAVMPVLTMMARVVSVLAVMASFSFRLTELAMPKGWVEEMFIFVCSLLTGEALGYGIERQHRTSYVQAKVYRKEAERAQREMTEKARRHAATLSHAPWTP